MSARQQWGVEGLTVRYGAHTALDGVSLAVPGGAVTAVVGGDGAGKTTLLRALAGAGRPAGGVVRRPPAAGIGYVTGTTGVYVDLTVSENLAFAGSAYGLHGAALRERAGQLLADVGLTGAEQRLAGRLSGGMRQKLAFAMAVIHQPALLVLDEATTGVDPVSRADLWRLIAGAAAGGAGVLFATTYLDEAERAATVLVLDAGHALLSGTPQEIVAAVPGAVVEVAGELPAELRARSWRRGRVRHLWVPLGTPPAGAVTLQPDLADAAIVAALAARQHEAAA